MPRYIDADALKSALENNPSDFYDYDELIPLIDAQPTVSPDEVRGAAKVNYDHGDYSCSACGHPARRLSFARKKYCDECGAKLLWEVGSHFRVSS